MDKITKDTNLETLGTKDFEENYIAKSRILVVDDVRMMRDFLVNFLLSEGAEVDGADNGDEALRILQTGILNGTPYHLVMTDLIMPVLNGIELLTQIRADTVLRTTPVIVLTSGTEEELINECSRHSVSSYITKPAKVSHLRYAVNKALACSAHSILLQSELAFASIAELKSTILENARLAIKNGEWTAESPDQDRVVKAIWKWIDQQSQPRKGKGVV